MRFFLAVLIAFVLLSIVLVDSAGADATIGIYADPYGAGCSLAGNAPGVVTAYVFVKPGSIGVRSARFAAPVPSCFDATFVGESTPGGIVKIGDSQTGISVSSGTCETTPFQVLQITYFSNGGTTPCCEYPIVADPFTGALEAIDCSFQPTTISSSMSYFNANATCPCGTAPPTYLPPDLPYNPLPGDQATYVAVNTQLRWQTSDPNGLGLVCDLYLGTDSNPPLIATDISSAGTTIYTPDPLQPATTYFWRVVVRNSAQLETTGPVWHFTTAGNGPPEVINLSPENGATTVPVTPTLTWRAVDPDGDPMTCIVYIGGDASPPIAVLSGVSSYTPSAPLNYSATYHWRVEATDSDQHTVTSPLWSFTTKAESEPPAVPSSPVPPNGATAISTSPTLAWTGSDPEGQALTYDVYLGLKSTPTSPSVGLYVDSYGSSCSFSGNTPGVVNAYVVVRPGSVAVWEVGFTVPAPACFNATYLGEQVPSGFSWSGNSQTGIDVWASACTTTPFSALQVTFMSNGATPCCEFTLGPSPELGHVEMRNCNGLEIPFTGIVSHLNADASCVCEGIFDLPLVASNLTQPSYETNPLLMQTAYQWRVVARDAGGLERSGPFWSFTTMGNQPPAVPSNPSPANGATNQSELVTLSWTSSDPEGQAITYDVYFGTAATPPLVASNLASASYHPGLQAFSTTYRWRVVARDASGNITTGPTWSYTTKAPNLPPGAPTVVSPANGATNQPVNTALAWNATDPETPNALTYDVYFGPANTDMSGSTIGLYADATGSTCSFSGNTPSVLTAYVIVKPDAVGIRGVRFSAPVPACLGGTYLGETVPSALVAIGSSQTGISIAAPSCLGQPFQVLQIMYMTNGSTAPCCEYPVLADPFTGHLEAVDCSYADTPLHTMLSHFNAGAACPCGTSALPLVAENISARSFQPGLLDVSTTYQWRILARDPWGLETLGQTWSFSTSSDANLPPLAASNPDPVVGGSTSINPVLRWQASDPDNDPLTFTIVVTSGFGSPIVGNTSIPAFSPGSLAPGVVYFWQVIAHDGHWSTPGPSWSFQAGTGGGETPVLFSRFEAAPQRDGVEIRWELSSDEPMEGFTLHRREGAAGTPVVLAQGRVNGTHDGYFDATAQPGKTYGYQLMIRATGGDEFRSTFVMATMPAAELALYQNHPNPFNPQTTIRYDLPGGAGPARVRLLIVDTTGRRVRTLVDEMQSGGTRSVTWNGRDDSGQTVSSGVYFYALDVGKERLTRKLVLLK